MRKFAFSLLSLTMAVAVSAEDLPPPPFIAPVEDLQSAPPPPIINIEEATVPAPSGGDSEAAPMPPGAEAEAPAVAPAAPTPSPIPTAAPKKSKKKKGKSTPTPTPAPTMLPAEGVQTNAALGSPAISESASDAPPAPVLNFTPETPAAEDAAGAAPSTAQESLVEAPPPPVINMPVESEAPAAPVISAGSYEQIGGQGGQPPTWFFTPEAAPSSAPEAPVLVVAAETPTPQAPAPAAEDAARAALSAAPAVPEAPVIFAPSEAVTPEAPPAPMISIGPEPTPAAPATEPATVTVKIEKPKPGTDILSDTVEAELKDAPKKNPEEAFSVALLLGRGKELEARGRYYEAWRTYRDLVKEYPKDLRGWGALNSFYARRLTERARKLEKQKRYYEAANLYRDIVTRDASVASAWWGLGALFHKYKKKEQALYCFDKVIALKPKMTEFKKWVKDYREGK